VGGEQPGLISSLGRFCWQSISSYILNPYLPHQTQTKSKTPLEKKESYGQRTRGDAVPGVLWRLQRILQYHICMQKDLQQDHPNSNPSSLLHLPHPHRSLQHPLQQDHKKFTTNDGNPTRHTPVPQPLQHALFRMGHLDALQALLLHLPPHLLPPLHLSSRIHRRLNLHRKRAHFLQGHDRRSQGLEETHGNLFVHLRGPFRLQRHGSVCFHHMGTYSRGKEWWSWDFCGTDVLLFRRVCLLNRGLESG